MNRIQQITRAIIIGAFVLSAGACGSAGALGNVLGGVLNAPGNQQASGTIQNVDTRNQQVIIRQSDGTTVVARYDNNTQVVYQNQNYPVTSLEYGDQVTARIQNNGNAYYTDLIQVNQSVSNNSTGNSNGQMYSFQGTVRQVDVSNGYFTLSTNNGTITVSMPYNSRSYDVNRFRNLRTGDYVSLQGTMLNSSRVELAQFTN